MFDWIGKVDPNQLGLGAIVTVMIISILRGWIIPRAVHKDRMDDKDKQIDALAKERDTWRDASLNKDATIAELTSQNGGLIEGADTTNRLMESLRNQIERGPQRQIGSGS